MIALPEQLAAITAEHYHLDAEGMRIVRPEEACKIRGESKSPFYISMQNKLHPYGIQLGPQSVGWPMAEVLVMQRARIARCSDEELKLLTAWLYEQRKVKALAA